jgi:hypothetical protein
MTLILNWILPVFRITLIGHKAWQAFQLNMTKPDL